MNVKYGKGKTEYGPGVAIELTGAEVATAISAFLVAHGVHVSGPRTITVNGELCETGHVYVDPSGFVVADGEELDGRGPNDKGQRTRTSAASEVSAAPACCAAGDSTE